MNTHPVPEPAQPEEWLAALRLLFQDLAPPERENRVTNALHLLQVGELNAQDILIIRTEQGLMGVVACQPLPGAGAVIFPPRVIRIPEKEALEDILLGQACSRLRNRGAKLIQALLAPEEEGLGSALLRHGFRNISRLWYLHHRLRDLPLPSLHAPERLHYQTYAQCTDRTFEETMVRTCEHSLDCPELQGVRSVDEAIEGHKAQGIYHPHRWWLAFEQEHPVGVLITIEVPENDTWDISYMGLIPEARGRGLGKELLLKGLWEARTAGAMEVTLSVDLRNEPAWRLYASVGFEPYDRREIYLLCVKTNSVGGRR